MPLTDEQSNQFQTWLNDKTSTVSCQFCGSNDWTPGDIMVPPVYSEGGTHIGGPSIPAVMLICETCARIELFAAVRVGLM